MSTAPKNPAVKPETPGKAKRKFRLNVPGQIKRSSLKEALKEIGQTTDEMHINFLKKGK